MSKSSSRAQSPGSDGSSTHSREALDAEPGTIADWILGSMSSGILAIDSDGRVAMFNRGAQRILGCDRSIGQPCRDVLETQPTVANLLLDTLAGRPALSRAELVLDGARDRLASTIGFSLTPLFGPGGEIRGAAMIFRDLTPIERMDEQQRLTERLAALGQMAAGLAHEIRNPLAGMEVIAGLLKRRLVGHDEERELLEQLTGELRRLAETVTDCLDFVKPMVPECGLTDLTQLVEDSLAVALSRYPFDGSVERAFAPEIEPIHADASQLRSVVTNLIVNAIEAMAGDNGGRRKRLRLVVDELARPTSDQLVRVDRQGVSRPESTREVVVAVSDSGPGVPEDLRERIFYPFFTTKQSGSGVGLATAQKIAANHGGALELDDGPDCGATLRLRLRVGEEKP